MKIPSKLKIGAYDYKIKWKKGLVCKDKEELWGWCDQNNHVIYLSKKMGTKRLREVIIHECIHAIEDSYGIELGEKKVNILGLALMALISDNKLRLL